MNGKFISFVVSCYNVAAYIGDCLDSIIAQTDSSWEIVAVDDGATDETGGILDAYAARDSRIRVLHKQNSGVAAARNTGLENVRGKWVWFVDGDDAVHPDAVRFLRDAVNRFPDADSFMFRQYVEQENIPIEWPKLTGAEVSCETQRNSKTYYYARCTAWTTIFRRSGLYSLRFETDCGFCEDTIFSLSYYWQTKKWIVADATMYFYRITPGSFSRIVKLNVVRGWLCAELRFADWLMKYSDQWTREGMAEFFAWNASVVWYTHREWFFRLSVRDAAECLQDWLTLQRKQFALSGLARWDRCMIVWLLGVVPSVRLCRVLVLGGRKLRTMMVPTENRARTAVAASFFWCNS